MFSKYTAFWLREGRLSFTLLLKRIPVKKAVARKPQAAALRREVDIENPSGPLSSPTSKPSEASDLP